MVFIRPLKKKAARFGLNDIKPNHSGKKVQVKYRQRAGLQNSENPDRKQKPGGL